MDPWNSLRRRKLVDDRRGNRSLIKTGLDFRKKPWGQLAPKFLDLVTSTNFLVAKNFSALWAENFYLKNPQYNTPYSNWFDHLSFFAI